MSSLKQRVPMADVRGSQAFVTIEWLNDLKRDIASSGSTTTSSSDVAALTATVLDLQADLLALTERVRKLEQGYQA